MKKRFLCVPIVIALLFPAIVFAQPRESEDTLKGVLLTTLSPHISAAITGYYGEPRLYGLYNAEILNIDRLSEGGYSFRVKVIVKTFVGAHNPPYGNEAVTMTVSPFGVSVEQFQHKKG
jgi:hypothetical protein